MTITELRFPVSPEAADELFEAIALEVSGPDGTHFSADEVIKIVKDLLAEPKIRDVTIVNGPLHGGKLFDIKGTGITLNVPSAIQLRRYPEDADIRYANPTFMNLYFILGDFAYYIGQRIMAVGPLGMPHLDAENV